MAFGKIFEISFMGVGLDLVFEVIGIEGNEKLQAVDFVEVLVHGKLMKIS